LPRFSMIARDKLVFAGRASRFASIKSRGY
jgi:hypothetical protein